MVNKYALAQPRGFVPPLLELEFRNPAQRFLEFLNLSVFRQMDAEVITDQGSHRPTRDPCDPLRFLAGACWRASMQVPGAMVIANSLAVVVFAHDPSFSGSLRWLRQ